MGGAQALAALDLVNPAESIHSCGRRLTLAASSNISGLDVNEHGIVAQATSVESHVTDGGLMKEHKEAAPATPTKCPWQERMATVNLGNAS